MKAFPYIINFTAGFLILASMFVLAAQLIAIPSEMVVSPRTTEACSSYIYSGKYGWKCPQFGTITTKPIISIAAILVNSLSLLILWFRIKGLRQFSVKQMYEMSCKFQFGFITLLVTIGRSGQYYLGSARIEFIYWLLLPILLSVYWWVRFSQKSSLNS
jgi:hypothetical protein